MKLFIFYTLVITFNSLVCHVIGLEIRQQKDAVDTPGPLNLRNLPWAQVNFIHTTDTHGWLEGHVLEGSYNGDLGDFYSFTFRMKHKARQLQRDLFIVDTGDTHDGNGLSDITTPVGKLTQPLLKNIPYDILTIGNHELYVNDVTIDVIRNFVPHWKNRYLTSNVYFKDLNNNKTVPIGDKYAYFEGEFGTRVLAFGFLFNFGGNGNLSVVQTVEEEIKKDWFQAALKNHSPDIITFIGHIGLRSNEFKVLIRAIREYYFTIPIVVLGGHTHIRDAVKYDPWAAGIESGKYLETVGFFSIDGIREKNVTFNRRYLDQNRATYIHHSVDGQELEFDTELGRNLSSHIYQLRQQYELSTALGYAPHHYKRSTVSPKDNSSIFHLLLNDVFPKVVKESNQERPIYYIINTGGVRYDIYSGPFTTDTIYQLTPFEDEFHCISQVPVEYAQSLLNLMNEQGEIMMKKKRDVTQDQQQACFGLGSPLTPGFTTKDDFGTDGDDTLHTEIPQFDLPVFVANEVPTNAPFIDIVYVSFLDNQIKYDLNQLSGSQWSSIKNYGNLTTTTMWIEYVGKYWQNKT